MRLPFRSNMLGEVNSFLFPGDMLISDNGQYQLVFQVDGSISFLSQFTTQIANNNTPSNNPDILIFQNDCNFVAYDTSGTPYWASNTGQTSSVTGALLTLNRDEASFSIYTDYGNNLIKTIQASDWT